MKAIEFKEVEKSFQDGDQVVIVRKLKAFFVGNPVSLTKLR